MATPSAHAPLSVTESVTSTYPELGKAGRGLTEQAIVVGKEKENDEKETSERDELRQKDAKETDQNSEKSSSLLDRIFGSIRAILLTLLRLPYTLMFMPMDRILLPGSRRLQREHYKDARDKVHTKSWIKLLMDENDIDWIMSLMFYCEDADIEPLIGASALAGAAFGTIHCVAWDFGFPSEAEKVLWRAMALALVGVCLSVAVGLGLYTLFVYGYYAAERGSKGRAVWLGLRRMLMMASKIPCAVYPVARISLLVLAVLSLRDLPGSALETVTWTKFIPHI